MSSKNTHWREWANNSLEIFNGATEEDKTNYRRKMFKIGQKIAKMPVNKPKIKHLTNAPAAEE